MGTGGVFRVHKSYHHSFDEEAMYALVTIVLVENTFLVDGSVMFPHTSNRHATNQT